MEKLKNWKDLPNRKPLVLNGARQVGKTWLLREFGGQCYEKTAYINLGEKKEIKELFETRDAKKIITGLKKETGVNIEPGNTLVILDEIEEVPGAVSALKILSEKASEYHIAVTGSNLGIMLHEGTSFPVGKVDFLNLYPLNFKEFLLALGKEEYAAAIEGFDAKKLSEHGEGITEELKKYCLVGGMPEAVNEFAKNGDYEEVRKIQKALLRGYENDFSKHVPYEELCGIMEIWNNFSAEAIKKKKRFTFGTIISGKRQRKYGDAVNTLAAAGLLYKVKRVNDLKVPCWGRVNYNAQRLYFLDVGLLAAKNNLDEGVLEEGNKIFTEYEGFLTQQFVVQELKASYGDMGLFYQRPLLHRKKTVLAVQKGNEIVPAEVITEKSYKGMEIMFCTPPTLDRVNEIWYIKGSKNT